MAALIWVFDGVLAATLVWLAWRVLASADLFKAVVLFIAFGLFLALAWARLDAPDVALAETAIGAGLTGVLMLTALRRLGAPAVIGKPATTDRLARPASFLLGVLALLLAVLLGLAAVSLTDGAGTLPGLVLENLAESGVSHPVTAVLLNFRGYDTMLEIGVLLLVLVAVWSLGTARVDAGALTPAGPVLNATIQTLIPLLVLVAGYLLWVGAAAPGGAFQAGAILAAAGILLMLAGWTPSPSLYHGAKAGFAAGLLTFIAVAAGTMLAGGTLLQYPQPLAAGLILLVETAASISIGLTLAGLYLGGLPAGWGQTEGTGDT